MEIQIPAVIVMGSDKHTDDDVRKKLKIDGELYLFGINKFNIGICGKPLVRWYLEEFDSARAFNELVPVVGDEEAGQHFSEWTKDLVRNYKFLGQEDSRYKNALKGAREHGFPELLYVTGADAPLAYGLDERVLSHKDKQGRFRDANVRLLPIEDFGAYWRSPFFFYNDLMADRDGRISYSKRGYKEGIDWLINPRAPILERLIELNFGTKMSDPEEVKRNRKNFLKHSKEWAGIYWTARGIAEVTELDITHREHIKIHKGKRYPLLPAPDLSILRMYAARLFGIDASEINLGHSTQPEFHMDVDSLQDAYRVALILFKKVHGRRPMPAEWIASVRYEGKPLLYHPWIQQFMTEKDFFEDYHEKAERMRRFVASRNVYKQAISPKTQ